MTNLTFGGTLVPCVSQLAYYIKWKGAAWNTQCRLAGTQIDAGDLAIRIVICKVHRPDARACANIQASSRIDKRRKEELIGICYTQEMVLQV